MSTSVSETFRPRRRPRPPAWPCPSVAPAAQAWITIDDAERVRSSSPASLAARSPRMLNTTSLDAVAAAVTLNSFD